MVHPGHTPSVVTPTTTLEPGDRFEVALAPPDGRLILPDYLQANPIAPEKLEDDSGRPLVARWDPAAKSLIVADATRLALRSESSLWLEYRDQGRFRLLVDPEATPPIPTEITTEQGVPIELDPQDNTLIHGPPPFIRRPSPNSNPSLRAGSRLATPCRLRSTSSVCRWSATWKCSGPIPLDGRIAAKAVLVDLLPLGQLRQRHLLQPLAHQHQHLVAHGLQPLVEGLLLAVAYRIGLGPPSTLAHLLLRHQRLRIYCYGINPVPHPRPAPPVGIGRPSRGSPATAASTSRRWADVLRRHRCAWSIPSLLLGLASRFRPLCG